VIFRTIDERERAAGYYLFVLTIDLPVRGQRYKDVTNALSISPLLTLPTLASMLTKPQWRMRTLRRHSAVSSDTPKM
jgi:L-lactate dehydrogenase (cytochrome)